MADGVKVHNPVPAGTDEFYNVSTDEDGDGKHVQRIKLAYAADGSKVHVPADADGLLVNLGTNNDVTVSGEVELGAASLAALESIGVAGPLTDGQLRATPVPVSGTVTVTDGSGALTVDGAVSVTGNVAHDAVDSGNPVKIGGVAVDFEAMPADVTVGDRVNAAYTPKGVAAVALFSPENSMPLTVLPVTFTGGVELAAGDANIGNVDVLTVPAPLSTTGGGTEATALRVTLASDSTGLVSVDDNGGSLTVDGTFFQATQPVSAAALPLPTGAATSALQAGGLPAALAAGGGLKVEGVAGGVAQPVSAAALPLPTGAATSALQTQPGVDVGDVTVNNAAGAAAVNVQDGGNSLTVDGTVAVSGTVAVTQSGAWDEVGINDSGNSITVDGTVTAISGTAANLKAEVVGTGTFVTQSVVTNAGTFAVQDSAAETSLALIDDAVYADDAARSKTLAIGAVLDDVATTAVTENQAGFLRMSSRRALLVEGVASGTALVVNNPTAANLKVDPSGVTSPVSLATLPALVAGSANIGDVDVLTVPADPFGANADAASATGSVSAKLRFIAATGIPVTALPALVAGTANIGDVDVLTVPAPLSTTGNGTAATALRVSVASDSTGQVVLAAGAAAIGKLAANSGVDIGDVDVTSITPGTGATNQGKAIDAVAGATDTGVAPLAVRDDALTTLTPIDGDYVPLRVNSVGALYVDNGSTLAPTGTLSNVAGSATSVTVLAANVLRKGAIVVNDSASICYLKFGSTASATSFTAKLQPDAYYEVPYGYTGILTGIWDIATGSARVTEVT